MTKDEIIQMLLEASNMSPDTIPEKENDLVLFYMDELERFAALVAEKERRCNIECIGRIAAMVCDPIDKAKLYEAIDVIRARGQK